MYVLLQEIQIKICGNLSNHKVKSLKDSDPWSPTGSPATANIGQRFSLGATAELTIINGWLSTTKNSNQAKLFPKMVFYGFSSNFPVMFTWRTWPHFWPHDLTGRATTRLISKTFSTCPDLPPTLPNSAIGSLTITLRALWFSKGTKGKNILTDDDIENL